MARKLRLIGPESSAARPPEQATQMLVTIDKRPLPGIHFSHFPALPSLRLRTPVTQDAAGAGVPVAKHGNRSYPSRSGSADVLEALGVRIDLPAEAAAEVLERTGIVFLFAPTYHPAMRHVGPVRRELGTGTIMNLLGPLANPAGGRRQVIGVSDAGRAAPVAAGLAPLGAPPAVLLPAGVGLDEGSPWGPADVWG